MLKRQPNDRDVGFKPNLTLAKLFGESYGLSQNRFQSQALQNSKGPSNCFSSQELISVDSGGFTRFLQGEKYARTTTLVELKILKSRSDCRRSGPSTGGANRRF